MTSKDETQTNRKGKEKQMGTELTTRAAVSKGPELLTALIKQEPGWLDRPIEEVARMVDLGSIWLQTQRMILKKIKPTDVQAAADFWKSRLEVARIGARGYFEGMKKIGEVRANVPPSKGGGDQKSANHSIVQNRVISKKASMEAIGISTFTGQAAEWIYLHPDLVDIAFKEAEQKNDFPSLNNFLALAGRLQATGRRSRNKGRQQTAQQMADAIHKELLEINVLMDGLVEHLDQVKMETMKGIFEATRRLVEILTEKAPKEYKDLGRRLE